MAIYNRTLRLGYVNLVYPVLTECGVDPKRWLTCDRPGISAEIWRTLLPYLNYSSVEFVKIRYYGTVSNFTATPESLLGQLNRGGVDASFEYALFENEARFGHVLFSAPVSFYHIGFVAGDLIDNKQTSLKIEVFQRLPLLLLVLLTLFIGLVHGLINGNIRDGIWRALTSACMQFKDDPRGVRNPIIVMGYAILIVNYYAGFRSQALSMTIIQSPLFRMDYIRQNLGSGKVPLIISTAPDLGPDARKHLYGDANANADLRALGTIIEPNPTLAAALLCTRQDILFFGSIENLRWGNKQKNCWLRTLRIPFYDGTLLDLMGPMAFALSPRFPRKQKKIIDDIILRILTPAHIEEYWMPKYDINMDNNDVVIEHAFTAFKSITTDHIWPAIILAIVGFSSAIALFLAEYLPVTAFLKSLSARPR